MNPDPRLILEWLRAREDEMADLLVRWAEIESPSDDVGSLIPMRAALAHELAELDFLVRSVGGRVVGRHLFARPRSHQRGAPIQLIVGHMDTVWPLGTVAAMPVVRHHDGRLSGPGTFDMKSGLVQALFALRALREHDVLMPVTPVVFVNNDEEIGSNGSRPWLRRLGMMATRAFVLEGAFGLDGLLKTGRKGVGRYTLRVKGVAAHAGLDPAAGVSAVLEISHQVQQLFDLSDHEAGTTVNVGTIDGGLRPNVVAPEASAEIDVRVLTADEAARIDRAIREMPTVHDGVTVEVTGGFGRLPMAQTDRNLALWEVAARLGRELGIGLDHAFVGGASDANILSEYTAVLDGLGGVGDGAHAAHEHVVVSAMPERAALLALLLAQPAS